ncbi:hypothetical protein HRI_003497800 [Hibiscus trionum]|uniref:Protein transport protein Sec61 subunit beta n=2 Tax=Hibiscus trionum TaxID=183268 RepID=A0A9W7MFK2_HIBTR|nr:hypothetical protein HRI_003497800 [Hibiscus trionum]
MMTWLILIGWCCVEGPSVSQYKYLTVCIKSEVSSTERKQSTRRRLLNLDSESRSEFRVNTEMATGTAPPRGSAAAAASLRRRRTTSGGGASGGAAGTMLQFYTDDAPGLKISPNVVLVMSIGFIAFVAVLHVMGKLYFVRKD